MLDDGAARRAVGGFRPQELARVTGQTVGTQTAPDQPAAGGGPSSSDVAAAENMDPAQRTAMIRGMVQRLADRLHGDGSDVDGWLRLVRAYAVLGDRDKAKDAAADARRALQDHPDAGQAIDDLVEGPRARRLIQEFDAEQEPKVRIDAGSVAENAAMTRKQRRLVLIGGGLGVLAVAVALMLNAFRDSIVFFNSPSDVAEKHVARHAHPAWRPGQGRQRCARR